MIFCSKDDSNFSFWPGITLRDRVTLNGPLHCWISCLGKSLFFFFNYKKLSLTTYENKIFNSRIWLKVNEADKPQSLHVQGLLGTLWCDFYHRWSGSCWCLSCAVGLALTGGRSRAGDSNTCGRRADCSTKNIRCWPWMQFPGTHNSKCAYIKTCCVSWYPVCNPNVMLSHWYHTGKWIIWSDVLLSLIKPNMWNFVFTDSSASLGWNAQQRNWVLIFVCNCISLLCNQEDWLTVFCSIRDTSPPAFWAAGWVKGSLSPLTVLSYGKSIGGVCLQSLKMHGSFRVKWTEYSGISVVISGHEENC